GIRVNFAAHAIHVNLDQIREGIERFIPHVFGNFRTSDDAAGVARQIFEQRIFLGGEWHTAASPGNALRCGIQDKVGDGYFGGPELTGTPQQSAEAREQCAHRLQLTGAAWEHHTAGAGKVRDLPVDCRAMAAPKKALKASKWT